MEPNSTSKRLHALDGIRGLAILFVVLTHINALYSDSIGKIFSPWLVRAIFGSGITGVSMLFILSGFFMAFMYPHPTSASAFLQKRYTRIFPLFLTMSTVMMIFRLLPALPWFIGLPLILIGASITYFLWVFVIKKYANNTTKKILFFVFIILQLCVGLFYTIWISRQPPIVFNQQLPPSMRELSIWLVNATLTLPFGNYIPMVDGVYWSLAAEVLFYILYPFLCVPLVTYFKPFSKKVKILGLLSTLCLFAGLDIISHRILQLSMLQISLCYYFVMGITLGYLYRNRHIFFQKIHLIFPGLFGIATLVIFFVIFFGKLILLYNYPQLSSWIHLLWAFPMTAAIALALDSQTKLAKFLENRFLVYIGTISYSIYLAHAPILLLLSKGFQTSNMLLTYIYIVGMFIVICTIPAILFILLEKPYFHRQKQKESTKADSSPSSLQTIFNPILIVIFIITSYCIVTVNTYQSRFNFFSVEYTYPSSIFVSGVHNKNTKMVVMDPESTLFFTIPAYVDNFQVITMHIAHHSIQKRAFQTNTLQFKIKEQGQNTWYSQSAFDLEHIAESIDHPFGFPTISNSKGKVYTVALSLTNPLSSEYLTVDTGVYPAKGVYAASKTELIKNPLQLLSFSIRKVQNALSNHEAQYALLLLIPFLLITLYTFTKKRIARLRF